MRTSPALVAALVIAVTTTAGAVFHRLQDAGHGGTSDPPPEGTVEDHRFRVEGDPADWPYYPKVYFRTRPSGAAGDEGWSEWDASPFEADGTFVVPAPRRHAYQMLSELAPPQPMQRLFWMIRQRGTFRTDGTVEPVPLPPRARIRLLAGRAAPGDEIVTVVREGEDGQDAVRGWFVNDPVKGVFEGFQGGDEIGVFQRRALNRPVVIDTFLPGTYVVAAKVPGKQWSARRMTLHANETVDVDGAAVPEGGGTVTCRDGDAVLLLDGELPIPFPWKDYRYRYVCSWSGVPPGRHAILHPDGRRSEFDLGDGATVEIPR